MIIHKISLQLVDKQTIIIPAGAKILTVQDQRGILTLWYAFSEEAFSNITNDNRVIHIIGTGNSFPEAYPINYISTVQLNQFVWHIFQEMM